MPKALTFYTFHYSKQPLFTSGGRVVASSNLVVPTLRNRGLWQKAIVPFLFGSEIVEISMQKCPKLGGRSRSSYPIDILWFRVSGLYVVVSNFTYDDSQDQANENLNYHVPFCLVITLRKDQSQYCHGVGDRQARLLEDVATPSCTQSTHRSEVQEIK